MVPSLLKRYSTGKPLFQFYGNISSDPFLPDHLNWIPSQRMYVVNLLNISKLHLYLFTFHYLNMKLTPKVSTNFEWVCCQKLVVLYIVKVKRALF